MFNNIGSKIKTLAKVEAWIGIITSFIVAIVFFKLAKNSRQQELYLILGYVSLLLGSFLSWIGSIITYGYGELIEKTASIEKIVKYDD